MIKGTCDCVPTYLSMWVGQTSSAGTRRWEDRIGRQDKETGWPLEGEKLSDYRKVGTEEHLVNSLALQPLVVSNSFL